MATNETIWGEGKRKGKIRKFEKKILKNVVSKKQKLVDI
jgi:hypothetical protein